MDEAFQQELERRLRLMESDDQLSILQPDLPVTDLVLAAVGVVAMTLLMLWWAY